MKNNPETLTRKKQVAVCFMCGRKSAQHVNSEIGEIFLCSTACVKNYKAKYGKLPERVLRSNNHGPCT